MRWSRRAEVNVVSSEMGKTRLSPSSGRKALTLTGTGAPVRKKRWPMTEPAVIAPPGLRSVLAPLRPVWPPDEASVAYWTAAPATA